MPEAHDPRQRVTRDWTAIGESLAASLRSLPPEEGGGWTVDRLREQIERIERAADRLAIVEREFEGARERIRQRWERWTTHLLRGLPEDPASKDAGELRAALARIEAEMRAPTLGETEILDRKQLFLEGEISRLQRKVEDLLTAKVEAQGEARRSTETSQTRASEVRMLEAELARATARRIELEARLDEERKRAAERETELRGSKQVEAWRNQEALRYFSDRKRLRRRLAKFVAQWRKARRSHGKLIDQVRAARANTADARAALEPLTREIEALKAERAAVEEEMRRLLDQKNVLVTELAVAREAVRIAPEEIDRLRSELQHSTEERGGLQKRIEELLKKHAAELQAERARADAQRKALEQQLLAAGGAHEAAAAEVAKLKAEVEKLKEPPPPPPEIIPAPGEVVPPPPPSHTELDQVAKVLGNFSEKLQQDARMLRRLAGGRMGGAERDGLKRLRERAVRLRESVLDLAAFIGPVPAPQATNVGAQLQEALRPLEKRFNKRRISVIRKTSKDLPPVLADAAALRRVFTDLFLNAHEAMPRGGVLTVRAEPAPSGGVVVRFLDTGPGLPESVLSAGPTAFATEKKGQLGIGLAAARRALEAWGGKLTFSKDKGAVVSVELTAVRA